VTGPDAQREDGIGGAPTAVEPGGRTAGPGDPSGDDPVGRLVSFGGLLADLVVDVDAVPERGADVLARDFTQTVGGGFAVVAAAARLGMQTAFAGVLGDDPIAEAARQALRDEGVELLFPEPRAGSSGICIVLVDAGGERTMVTVEGVESRVQSEDFDAVALLPGDVVYLNGYELLYPHATGLVNWLLRVRPEHLVFDPGPLISKIEPAALEAVLGMTRWLSLNAGEAEALTGESDPVAAAVAALRRHGHEGVVVRAGAEGCVLAVPDHAPVKTAALPVTAVDTTGAGDTHVGAFIAALARGLDPVKACVWANAAAGWTVRSRGQVSPPYLEELRSILQARP
jgi:sugar/nucleoside kinase (ribokinase family)